MQKELFKSITSYYLGNGKRVTFWEQRWCLSKLLMFKFPALYNLPRKKWTVAEMCKIDGNSVLWMLDFRRRLTDNEICDFTSLVDLLDHISLVEREEKYFGTMEANIKFLAHLLNDKRRVESNLGLPCFPYGRIWSILSRHSRKDFNC